MEFILEYIDEFLISLFFMFFGTLLVLLLIGRSRFEKMNPKRILLFFMLPIGLLVVVAVGSITQDDLITLAVLIGVCIALLAWYQLFSFDRHEDGLLTSFRKFLGFGKSQIVHERSNAEDPASRKSNFPVGPHPPV